MVFTSYNTNVKLVFDLPLATHRHLIEPVTRRRHLRIILAARFMSFIEQIKKSAKLIPKMLLSQIQLDVRSTTGRNLRNILVQTDKRNVVQLRKEDCYNLQYHPSSADNKWKEEMLKELIDVKRNQVEVDGFDQEELDEIMEFICVG